jgi:tetratricopeptide (TPR) repeat protein
LLDVIGDEYAIAIVKSHQGLLKRQQGSYNQAETLMVDAAEGLERIGDLHQQAVNWFNLADLYMAMELYDQAWDYAERAHEVFAKLKSGWLDRAKSMLATLESITKAEHQERLSPFAALLREAESDQQISIPGPTYSPPPDGDDELYDEMGYEEGPMAT